MGTTQQKSKYDPYFFAACRLTPRRSLKPVRARWLRRARLSPFMLWASNLLTAKRSSSGAPRIRVKSRSLTKAELAKLFAAGTMVLVARLREKWYVFFFIFGFFFKKKQ